MLPEMSYQNITTRLQKSTLVTPTAPMKPPPLTALRNEEVTDAFTNFLFKVILEKTKIN